MKIMVQSILKFRLTLIMAIIAILSVHSQSTYEDLQGRFVIDLPNKWSFQPQEDPRVFNATKDNKTIIIQYNEDSNDPEVLFQDAIEMLKSAGYVDLILHSDVKEMVINGHPARWGVYKSEFQTSGVTITLYGLIGSIGLEEEGLYMVGIINESDIKKWIPNIEQSFHSIRLPDEEITGVSGLRQIDVVLRQGDLTTKSIQNKNGAPIIWSHSGFSMTLPPGWEELEITRNLEKEVIGRFNNKQITGANLTMLCYKGLIWSKKTVTDVSKKTIMAALPDAKITKSYQIKLANKRKANVIIYEGTSVAEGKEFPLGAVNIIYRAGKCNIHQMGMATIKGLSALEEQMISMANSIE